MGDRVRADHPYRDVAVRVRRNIEEHVREISRQRFAELSGRIRQPIRAAARRSLFARACIWNDIPLFGHTHQKSQSQLTATDHRAFSATRITRFPELAGRASCRRCPHCTTFQPPQAAAGYPKNAPHDKSAARDSKNCLRRCDETTRSPQRTGAANEREVKHDESRSRRGLPCLS